jgi:RNA polymerase sigma-70 factor (ECF subfamily)
VSQTDEQLYQALLQGNQQSFSNLYHRYFDKLCWFAQQFMYNKQEAEDIVQEVFTKIIEQPQHFDANQKFSTWVFTLTANRCKNRLKQQATQSNLISQHTSSDQSVNASIELDAKLLKAQIREIFASLNEKEKKLFVLKFEQHLSTKETSEILNIPEGSVKSGLYYLLKKIKEKLNYHG